MASTDFTQGTIEYHVINLVDLLGAVTDLASATPTFKVYKGTDQDTGTVIQASTAAVVQQMALYCLINTTTGSGLTTPTVPVTGWWQVGDYCTYVTFTEGSETPRIGPVAFKVVA